MELRKGWRPKARKSVLPGFGLTLGFTALYLSLVVLLPLATVIFKLGGLSLAGFWNSVTAPRVLAAYRLSFGASALAALVNVVFGLVAAWVLTRYEFPGRRLLDALVDLPFALPTAVAGIALTQVYSIHGVLGAPLDRLGVRVAFAPLGVWVALVFIGLPFVVRTLQPILEDLEPELEEAAACMGAGRGRTLFQVILPGLWPGLLTGFSLAFARALGEYGSVVFISGNMPFRTEIVPLVIMTRLEQFDYQGAAALAVVMLVASFAIMLIVNILGSWAVEHYGAGEKV